MDQGLIFLIFFVIVIAMRAIGWFLRTVQQQQQQQRQQQRKRSDTRRPGARPISPAGSPRVGLPPRPRPKPETPFQAMLRMIEEAAEAQERPRVEESSRPRPRPVPVARPVEQLPPERTGALADHHLKSDVAGRHIGKKLKGRHLSHLESRLGMATGIELPLEEPEASLEERLERLTPLQRAVVMAEVIGPPRARVGYRPVHLR